MSGMVDFGLPCRSGFLNSSLLMFWDGLFVIVGGCLVHCRMFSSVLGFFSLSAISTPPPVVTFVKCLQTLSNISVGSHHLIPPSLPVENHYSLICLNLLIRGICKVNRF